MIITIHIIYSNIIILIILGVIITLSSIYILRGKRYYINKDHSRLILLAIGLHFIFIYIYLQV